ncbi:MAG: phytoene/squalene synthase family protein, partial [Candidatus Binatia bacterium]
MAADGIASRLLYQILPRVSRSFYLSVCVLPQSLRQPIGLAYLFCRAADTIADTILLPRNLRLTYLDQYRAAFNQHDRTIVSAIPEHLAGQQSDPAERELLACLTDCFTLLSTMNDEDQQRICELVLTLTQGMELDLTVFPGEDEGQKGKIGALPTRTALDQYTYFVAGCVGEFWTRTIVAHRTALRHWDMATMETRAVRFGKGLQLTNILRDIAQDLRLGRCYLPRIELAALGIQPEELLDPNALTRIKPLVSDLLDLTLSHYREGWAYTLAIPRREWWLRLACAWPLLIGLSTLALVSRSSQLLDPNVRLKV